MQRSLAPLATMALGGMALTPATVFAEGPSDFKVCHSYSTLKSVKGLYNLTDSTVAKTYLR